jgi:hypothetical protein
MVATTVLDPKSAQVNVVLDRDREVIPQLSELEPVAAKAEAVALVGLRTIVCEVQVGVGLVLSCTTTTALQVAEFPVLSATVAVTVLDPKSAQVNVVLDRDRDVMPQLSVLPVVAVVGLAVALDPLSTIVWEAQVAVGAVLS